MSTDSMEADRTIYGLIWQADDPELEDILGINIARDISIPTVYLAATSADGSKSVMFLPMAFFTAMSHSIFENYVTVLQRSLSLATQTAKEHDETTDLSVETEDV